MTVCVAAICEDERAIVLVADKLVGVGFIEAEPEIKKIFRLHQNWWALIAGNNVSPAFDIVDDTRRTLDREERISVEYAILASTEAFQRKRRGDAEAVYLRPRGLSVSDFYSKGRDMLPERLYVEIDGAMDRFQLDLQLLVAGFDVEGRAHIFTVITPAVSARHDIPGFHAIGSGQIAALYQLYYREIGPRTALRKALYGSLESKYFAEQATGVGERTDIHVIRPGREPIILDEKKTIEGVLFKIAEQHMPRLLTRKQREMLDGISELHEFGKLGSRDDEDSSPL